MSSLIPRTGSFFSFTELENQRYSEFASAELPADDGDDFRSVSPASPFWKNSTTLSPMASDCRSPSPVCCNDTDEPTVEELVSILNAVTITPKSSPSCSSSTASIDQDLGTDLFHSINQTIEADIANQYFGPSREKLTGIKKGDEDLFQRYLDSGSFYPALIPSLKTKDFASIYTCIEALSSHEPSFLTAKIEFCRAACLYAMGREEKCKESLLKTCSSDSNQKSTLRELLLEDVDLWKLYVPILKFIPGYQQRFTALT